jgi:hypothetical protein
MTLPPIGRFSTLTSSQPAGRCGSKTTLLFAASGRTANTCSISGSIDAALHGDHLGARCEQNLLVSTDFGDARLEGVDELDRRQPQPAHFTRHVLTHVREISILRADQVSPVAGGHVRLLLISRMTGDPGLGCKPGRDSERQCNGQQASFRVRKSIPQSAAREACDFDLNRPKQLLCSPHAAQSEDSCVGFSRRVDPAASRAGN